MKKILSILMILVLVGGAAFAQVEPAFKGDATLSWGIDLGAGGNAEISHGFKNEASASVAIDFLKDTKKSKGEGDVYALIDLSKINLGLSADMKEAKVAGGIGEVSAKVVFFGAYVTLYNAPNMTTNYATRILNGDNYKPFKTGFEGFGTTIGYANKDMMDLNVGLKFVSNGSWEDRNGDDTAEHFVKLVEGEWNADDNVYVFMLPDEDHEFKKTDGSAHGLAQDAKDKKKFTLATPYDGANQSVVRALWAKAVSGSKDNNGKYAFGIDFHMTPVEKYLTVDAKFNMTIDAKKVYKKGVNSTWNDDRVMNFGVNLKSSPIEGLNFALGFDGGTSYELNGKGVFAWALGFGADYKAEKVGKFDLGVYVGSEATPYGSKKIDMAMTFGYEGLPLVEGLDVHTRVNVFKLLSTPKTGMHIPMGFNVGASYNAKITDSMSVKPYADFWVESNKNDRKDGTTGDAYLGLAYKLGVAFMPMERLTVDAYWMHGALGKKDNLGTGKKVTPAQHKANNGKFILSAKITF